MVFTHPQQQMDPTRGFLGFSGFLYPGKPSFEPDPYQTSEDHVVLNKDLDLVHAPDFYQVTAGVGIGEKPFHGYASKDPRLADVLRNDTLVLDRPPFQPAHVQPLCRSDSDSGVAPTASVFPSYENITGGNIQYYTDASISEAFYPPMYQIPSRVQSSIFKDPMGSLKAYYEKIPVLRRNTMLSEYSFDQDQMSFREDIMSRQQSLMDRTDYQKFHAHFTTS